MSSLELYQVVMSVIVPLTFFLFAVVIFQVVQYFVIDPIRRRRWKQREREAFIRSNGRRESWPTLLERSKK